MSVVESDPQLSLALVQMELRFSVMINQITLVFNAMLRAMKDGNVRQFRAAKVAMKEMSQSLRLTLETAASHLRSLPVP
jgi:hypothetical protein